MKKEYLSPTVKVMEVQHSQVLCGSVDGAFGLSNDDSTVEEGSKSDWDTWGGYKTW